MTDPRSTAEHLREHVARLACADTSFRVFGADRHRYQFNSCIAPDTLAAFESANRVVLPEDYREFLLRVGNGGAGPFYGLSQLDAEGRDLARPFPFEAEPGMSEPIERPRDEWGTRAPGRCSAHGESRSE